MYVSSVSLLVSIISTTNSDERMLALDDILTLCAVRAETAECDDVSTTLMKKRFALGFDNSHRAPF